MVRIACVQYTPVWGELEKNVLAVEAMVSHLRPGELDFLVLPEMAFAGYVFHSKEEIRPFVEYAGGGEDGEPGENSRPPAGPTYRFCRAQALRLRCCVVAGYAEVDAQGDFYNSLYVLDEHGKLRLNYRKTFLYVTDKAWAKPGTGFHVVELRGCRVVFGICMDLNCEDFDFERDTFALASFCRDQKAALLILSTAWLQSPKPADEDGDHEASTPAAAAHAEQQALEQLHNYWGWRLEPLLGAPCHFVAANRTGLERGSQFAGGSAVIDLERRRLVNHLGRSEAGLLITSIDVDRAAAAAPDRVHVLQR
ncbi:Protein N-terminal amidase [Porphyridium purpureum]|uniref:Protein N-terminal amidase n=1 Tax=Porphyridium purpureum TaxID=35688 RepID=A0A5J4YKR6_PORPP|nr:Protein N-terminal amidase [Porphyridium purpureum]|eukprot:POR1577..scf291_13